MLSLTKNFSDVLKKNDGLNWHYVIKIEQTADAHVNLVTNPGFEDSTGADYDGWTEDGSGTIANETTNHFAGSQCPKLTHDGANNKWMYQDLTVVAGSNYILSFYTRGNGSVAGLYRLQDTNGDTPGDIVAATSTGISGTTWTVKNVEFTAPADNCTNVRLFFQSPSSAGDAYFDDAHVQLASDYYYYSDKSGFDLTDIHEDVQPCYGVVKNTDIPIVQQINWRTHKASTGGFSIQLIDRDGDISNDWNSNNIYNRAIWIYLGIDDLDSLGQYLLLYKGVCKDWVLQGNVINLQIENNTFIVQQQIPALTSDSDASAGQGGILPDESKGLAKPFCFGDMNTLFIADTHDGEDGSTTSYDRSANMSECVFLGVDQDNKERWLVSSHQVESINSSSGEIWAFDTALGRMVEVQTYTVEQNTSSGCIISFVVDPILRDYWFPDGATADTTDTGGDGGAVVSNSGQACDLDNTTYCQIQVTDSTIAGIPSAYTDVDFPTYNNPGTIETNGVDVWALGYKIPGGGNTPVIEINATTVTRDTSEQFKQYGQEADSIAGVGASVRCSITGEDNVTAHTHNLRVYMIFKMVQYKAGQRLKIYAAIQGREYSGTWNSRKTSGNLIEHPTDVIESILRDDLSLTDDDIDMDSFDDVNTELSGWKFAGSITERQNSKDILEEFARQCMSFVFWGADNKVKMDTFYASNTTNRVIDIDEVAMLPKVYKSKLSDIVNTLTLRYYKEATDGRLLKAVTREDDRASTGSQDVYNAEMVLDLEAEFIADDTTAGLLADHWVKDDADSFWSILHDVIEVDLVSNRGIDFWDSSTFKPLFLLELSDIIELDDADFDSFLKCNGASWSGKQFKIFYIKRRKQGLLIRAFSV